LPQCRRRKLHRKRLIGFCSPTLAEQIGDVCQRFYQRFSAFQNTELSNSLSPPAEPGVYQCNYVIGPVEFVVAAKDAPTARELLAHLDDAVPEELAE
jgi:hypothetical protein